MVPLTFSLCVTIIYFLFILLDRHSPDKRCEHRGRGRKHHMETCKDEDQDNLTGSVSRNFFSSPFQVNRKILRLPSSKRSLLHGGKPRLLTIRNMSCLIQKPKIIKELMLSVPRRMGQKSDLKNTES